MGHEIESTDVVGLRGEQAWHGLGTVIQDDLTALESANRFGLVWPVGQWPLVANSPAALAAMTRFEGLANMDGVTASALANCFREFRAAQIDVDSHVANVREADNAGNVIKHLLGVVGADYQVCQNRELAEFTDALAQSGKVTVESCGSIRGGKRVWFLAKGEAFSVGGVDKIFPYILVSNGHDGTQAIRVTPTTVRVVCSNTLHMVIPSGDFATRPETAAITIRHSGKIADKLEQAKRALEYYGNTLRQNQELFEAMHARRIDRDGAVKLFADSYAAFWEVATPAELNSPVPETYRNANNRMERMQKASAAFLRRYDSEKRELGLGDSIWTAFNAMTGFIQHDKTARGKDDAARVERRIESNLFGVNAGRTHEVLAASLALAC